MTRIYELVHNYVEPLLTFGDVELDSLSTGNLVVDGVPIFDERKDEPRALCVPINIDVYKYCIRNKETTCIFNPFVDPTLMIFIVRVMINELNTIYNISEDESILLRKNKMDTVFIATELYNPISDEIISEGKHLDYLFSLYILALNAYIKHQDVITSNIFIRLKKDPNYMQKMFIKIASLLNKVKDEYQIIKRAVQEEASLESIGENDPPMEFELKPVKKEELISDKPLLDNIDDEKIKQEKETDGQIARLTGDPMYDHNLDDIDFI